MSALRSAPVRAQQERTREVRRRILDAATKVLVDEGYAQATTLRIQEEAGVSRGRLLHHFPSRAALLLAATHHLVAERMTESDQRASWPSDPRARIDAAIDTLADSYRQPYFWAATELWVAARVHDDLRDELFPAEQALGARIRADTERYFGAELAAHPLYPQVRDMILTSLRGVALTTSFDHRPRTMTIQVDNLKLLARHLLLTEPTTTDPTTTEDWDTAWT